MFDEIYQLRDFDRSKVHGLLTLDRLMLTAEDIKNKKMDSVTVANIGGTECQKCHY